MYCRSVSGGDATSSHFILMLWAIRIIYFPVVCSCLNDIQCSGSYRLRIRYSYTLIISDNESLILEKYNIVETVLNGKGSSFSLPAGWNWHYHYADDSLDDEFWDQYGDCEGEIMKIDVIELTEIDSS